MIDIDGSKGEGGGQILRTALSMSLITGKPFRIHDIRAGRPKPGLMQQHLTAVKAAAEVGSAEVTGDRLGALELEFKPGEPKAGKYHFSVGTAGSTTLVMQTILPALLKAQGNSTVTLEGGTHNPHSPPLDFFVKAFLPRIEQMGAKFTFAMEQRGFYPAGGGKWSLKITPPKKIKALKLETPGPVTSLKGLSVFAKISPDVAKRGLARLAKQLKIAGTATSWEEDAGSPGAGFAIMGIAEHTGGAEVATGFGERGVKVEDLADNVAQEIRAFLDAEVPVGRHLADQLMAPMALAGEGAFRTLPLSEHSRTNIATLRAFVDFLIKVNPGDDGNVRVTFGK